MVSHHRRTHSGEHAAKRPGLTQDERRAQQQFEQSIPIIERTGRNTDCRTRKRKR